MLADLSTVKMNVTIPSLLLYHLFCFWLVAYTLALEGKLSSDMSERTPYERQFSTSGRDFSMNYSGAILLFSLTTCFFQTVETVLKAVIYNNCVL